MDEIQNTLSLLSKVYSGLESSEWFTGDGKAAEAFSEATAGTHTWYTTGKRSVHQPQLESLSSIAKHLVQNELHRGSKVTQLVELGAGKGLLGSIIQKMTSIPLTSVERRDVCANYDQCSNVTRVKSDLSEVELSTLIASDEKALAIAKHFCGPASDSAITTFITTPQVSLSILAPCCHPQITWSTYSNVPYLESLGFTEDHLPLLLDLLILSKYTKGISEKDCRRWKDLKKLPRDVVYTAGRQVRRIIEEGRARKLRENGFSEVIVVKYAPDSVTPDNLVIIAKRSKDDGFCKGICDTGKPIVPKTGVVFHCNGDTSVSNRLTEYLLELRSKQTVSTILQTVAIHTIKYSGDTLSNIIVIEGDPTCIVKLLAYNPLVLRTVDMLMPFRENDVLNSDSDCEDVCYKAFQNYIAEGCTYRICTVPRPLEQTLYSKVSCASPSVFTHLMFALVWKGRCDSDMRLLHSCMPEKDFNLREWRDEACTLPSWVKSKTDKAVHFFIVELSNRYLQPVPGSVAVIIFDDKKNPAVKTACETLETVFKMKSVCLFKDEASTADLTPTTPVQFVLFILGMGSPAEGVAKVLKNTHLPEGTPIVGQLKLGVQSRGRRALERALGPWKEPSAPFKDSWISHFVTDKETERAVISYYAPGKVDATSTAPSGG
eukprot:TRINITY_DN3935_c0_g1_i1.p1 TRINITY_DN3935_c0_g1~~TRINITY_DN3935_c0_g1_i1.p1  ORF type:complete len:660 (+),score=94.55 TRINITY_DN3935_c0_g1_i1:96-2075(+)